MVGKALIGNCNFLILTQDSANEVGEVEDSGDGGSPGQGTIKAKWSKVLLSNQTLMNISLTQKNKVLPKVGGGSGRTGR